MNAYKVQFNARAYCTVYQRTVISLQIHMTAGIVTSIGRYSEHRRPRPLYGTRE